jgi:hypothetical protein
MKYLIFFFLYFIFPVNLFATDNETTTQRNYPVPGHGELLLNVPVNWEVTYLSLAEDKPPIITFYKTDKQKRDIFQLNLSIFWDDGFKRDITKPENIKALVADVGNTILESSAESELVLNQITGTGGQGYYFKLSDKTEKAGEYKYLIQGALNVGELLLVFSLFTFEPDIQLQKMALTMLQTAMHKFQRHI